MSQWLLSDVTAYWHRSLRCRRPDHDLNVATAAPHIHRSLLLFLLLLLLLFSSSMWRRHSTDSAPPASPPQALTAPPSHRPTTTRHFQSIHPRPRPLQASAPSSPVRYPHIGLHLHT